MLFDIPAETVLLLIQKVSDLSQQCSMPTLELKPAYFVQLLIPVGILQPLLKLHVLLVSLHSIEHC